MTIKMRAVIASTRFVAALLVFALAAVVADESRAQVCDGFSKNLCGENTLCEPLSHTVICSPCPDGFAPNADNTQCVRVCPPNEAPDAEGNCVCNAETHLPNPCRLKQDDATSLCEAAGWTATDLTLAARVTVGAECEIPQRDETAQTDQTGCLLWRDQTALAEIQTLTTARKLCGELPMFADNNLPLAANHDEGDRYVHSCPAPKVHDADYDDCVCPAGYSTEPDGQCADINECEAQTYFCGDRVQCGNTEGNFVCGELCPNGFTLGSNRAECAETCDTTTHILNDEHHCAPLAATSAQTSRRQCDNAGWEAKTVLYATNTSVTLGVECAVPYRNATAQTDESGCWISDRGDLVFNAARNQGSTTATRRCWELFDLHGIPSADNHDEGDRYVHSCPGEKQPSADLKSCVCPSGYVENRAGQCVDINECVSESNICGANAQCSNTIGGFACSCKTGHAKISETLTSQCADIDECAMETHDCDGNNVCSNTGGGFKCNLCPNGFQPMPNHSACVPECGVNEKMNPDGSCYCDSATHYVSGDSCVVAEQRLIDICIGAGWHQRDLFSRNPNIDSDPSAPLLVRTGTECAIPYRNMRAQLDDSGCVLTGTTASQKPHCRELFVEGAPVPQAANRIGNERFVHSCPYRSVPSADVKTCVCDEGFMDYDGACGDINECTDGTHSCGANGVCANTTGGHACSCAAGYAYDSPDSLHCGDVDECAAATDDCGANSLCINTVGNFICGNICPAGFIPNDDRDQCVEENPCPAGETKDENGMCLCPEGQTRTGANGECQLAFTDAESTELCQSAGWTTADIILNFSIGGNFLVIGRECQIPYRDAETETDESGCFLVKAGADSLHENSTSTASEFCKDLFVDGIPMTLNHNDGDRYLHSCPAPKTLAADLKSCVCPSGYSADDEGECSFCVSPKITSADGRSCVCPPGQRQNSDGKCLDINECQTGDHSCGENAFCAVNLHESYACSCDIGYAPTGEWTLQNPQCGDVDECAEATDNCGANSLCENTVGGFACGNICPVGMAPNEDRSECADLAACPDYHIRDSVSGECVCNTAEARISDGACVPTGAVAACQTAGWEVETHEFLGNRLNVECQIPLRNETDQIDESGCLFLPPSDVALADYSTTASKTCYDLFDESIPLTLNHDDGDRYVHSCPGMKAPSADHKTCVCPAGYAENDEGICVDFDECAAGSHSCEENASCVNTVGAHACACNTGYESGEGWTFLSPNCGDVDECARGTDDCGANSLCANTDGGFLCGKTCEQGTQPNADRDECVECPVGETMDAASGQCVCDPETRFRNAGFGGACHLTSDGAAQTCMDAGWLVMTVIHSDINSGTSVTLGAVCAIPYRDETAQADETGCSVWQYYGHPDFVHWGDHQTTSRRCRDLFDAHPVPLSLHYDEGDRYVHSCPPPKAPGDDLKSCNCPAGYEEDAEGNCMDINECETNANTCGANAFCVNTPGTHACDCEAGYDPDTDTLQYLQCSDINECATGAHSCGGQANAYCANTIGDYECSCHADLLPLNPNDPKNPQCRGSFALTLSHSVDGTLYAEYEGITLEAGTNHTPQGATISITARPDAGYYLLKWTGDCKDEPSPQPHERGLPQTCELTANAEKQVGATFERAWQATFDSRPPNGAISARVKNGITLQSGDIAREGTTVIFTAAPDSGYYVLEWGGHCAARPAAEPRERGLSKTCQLTLTAETTVAATFKRAWQTTLNQPVNGTLSAQTNDGVTLRSGDITREGTTVIFTAAPDSGFYLLEWGGHCATHSPAAPHDRGLPQTCELTLSAETTVAATFDRAWETTFSQPDNGTLSAEIKGGVTLHSGDIVRQGTTIVYTALPDSGFYLFEWTDHCGTFPAARPSEHGLPKECELIANEARPVGATFARAGEITFNAQPPNGTLSAQVKDGETLRPGDFVRDGTPVIFTAQPNPGHYLLEWTGDCQNEPAAEPHERGLSKTCELSATPSTQIGATFQRAWQTTFDQPDNGALSAQTADGEAIQSADINQEGTTIIFTAQPDSGYYLLEWSGDCAGRLAAEPHQRGLPQTCELTLSVETTVAATFERAWETTFNSQPPNGTLSARVKGGVTLRSGDIIREGTTIIYTAQPDSGFYLLEWTDHCGTFPAAAPSEHGNPKECELTADEARPVGAIFARIGEITFNAQPLNGTLSARVKDGEPLRPGAVVRDGTSVIFTAQPNPGHYLLEWTGDCQNKPASQPHERGLSKTCELSATPSTQIGATFQRAWQTTFDSQPVNGTLSAQIKDGEPLQSGDIAQEGTTIIFTAQPDSGFYLLEWGEQCAARPAAQPSDRNLPQTCQLTLTAETTVAATFKRAWQTTFDQPVNGALSAQTQEGEPLRSSDIFPEGTIVTLTAQPDPGFYLSEWGGHCATHSPAEPHERGLSQTCELTLNAETTVSATFKRAWQTTFDQPDNGALSAQTADGETIQSADINQEGTTIIFTAQPDSGYYLLEWGGDCAGRLAAEPHQRGLSQTCELTLSAETTVAATFERAWETTFNQPDNGTLSAEVKGGVTLRSGDIVKQGTTIIYTAQPDSGFYLLEWTDHCGTFPAAAPSEHGLSKECELTADESRQVGAVFARVGGVAFNPQPSNGSLSAQIKDGETLSPGDVVRNGTTIIFTAQPDAGHYLLEWTGDCENKPAAQPHERGLSKTCELSASPSTQVGATFQRAWQTTFNSHPPNGTLSARVKGGVTLRSGDIIREGTTIIYTAQPDSGFYLLEWTDHCGTFPAAAPSEHGLPKECELTADEARPVGAVFARIGEITFNAQPLNGTLSAQIKDGETLHPNDVVREGTTIIFTAQPNAGHYLLEWTGDCENKPASQPHERGLSKTCELTASPSTQIGATFQRAWQTTFDQPDNGALSAQTKDGATLQSADITPEGTIVTFTAAPDSGFYLSEWGGHCATHSPAQPSDRGLPQTCQLTLHTETTVAATFKRAWQTTFNQPDNGALSAETTDGEPLQSGDITKEGTTIIFTAQPDPGFYLLQWGGHCASQPAAAPHDRNLPQTCQLTLTAETTVAATFKRAWQTTFDQPVNGALSAETTDGEILQSADINQEGTTIIFTAQPDIGFYLLEWGQQCATQPAAQPSDRNLPQTCQLTLTAETTVAATFERAWKTTFNQPVNGALSAETTDGETLQSADITQEGATIIFTAQPDSGFYLLEWGGDCAGRLAAEPHQRGLSQTCELTLSAETTVAATFERAWETTFSQPDNGTLSAEVKGGVTLRSGDIVREGTTIIYTAQPASGYYLLQWTDHCGTFPAAAPSEHGLPKECELIADESRQVGAIFARVGGIAFNPQPSNGSLSAQIKDGETLHPNDVVREGTTVIFTASPDAGHYLLEWTGDCENEPNAEPHERGLSKTCELTATPSTQIGATFQRAWQTTFDQPDNGTLSAQTKDGEPLQSSDISPEGTIVTLTAQPDPGFYLSEWDGHCATHSPAQPRDRNLPQTCQLTLTAETTVAATFERAWKTTFDQPPNGALAAQTADGEAIQSSDIFPEGTIVTLTAQPDPGFYLLQWGGHCADQPAAQPSDRGLPQTCQLTLNAETTIAATFERAWQATFNQPANGALSAQTQDGETLQSSDITQEGTTIIFTAQPDSGYYLLEWGGDCAGRLAAEPHQRGLSQTCELTLNAETTVSATFKRAWQTTFDSEPTNGSLSAETTDGEPLQSADITQEGATIIFTAQPDSGYYLLEWGGDCAGRLAAEPHQRGLSQTCELTLSAETTVAATFERAWETTFSQPDNGTLSAEIKDGETLQSSDIAQEGTTIIFTAQPDSGYYLLEWGGDCAGRLAAEPHQRGLSQTCELTLSAETMVAATFERAWETTFSQPDNGTLSAEIKDGETLQSGDIVREGTTIIYTAQPDSGFYLLEWTDHCGTFPAAAPSEHGLSKECELTADESRQVGAIFARVGGIAFNPQPSNGALSAQIKDGETLHPNDVVREGTTVIFTASPDAGHYLLEWTGDCENKPASQPHERGLSKTCELTATPSTQIGATFQRAWQTTFDQPPNGALSAQTQDGETLQSSDVTQEGTTIIFTAQPDSGFYLSEWGGHCATHSPAEPHDRGLPQTCQLTLHTETTIAATFKRAWQTTFDQPVNGALSAQTKDGETLQSADIFPEGTIVTLTAQPDPGFYLLEWGGDCAGRLAAQPSDRGLPQTCELTLHMEATIAATFERAWQATFNQPDNGTLSAQVANGAPLPSGNAARAGATIIITAQPDADFYLLKWTGACEGQTVGAHDRPGAAQTCELTADAEKQFGAVFQRSSKTMFDPAPHGGRLSARVKDGAELTSGETTSPGTTIVFTARPDPRYYLLAWTGDCENEPAASPNERGQPKRCEIIASGDPRVGALFKLSWLINFDAAPDAQGGTLSARVKDGKPLRPGDAVPDGATIIFTATPQHGFYMTRWTRNRAGRCDASFENPERDPVPQTCEAVVIGDSFEITPPAPEFNSSCLPIKNALGDEDNPGKCVCADERHLIFGEGENRFCAPPTICPTDYTNENNDCINHDADSLPAYANSPEGCEKVFGGRGRKIAGETVCLGLDIQGTFCVVNSRDAFPCRGLFKHARTCNGYNRPALNPFICAPKCPGVNTARGQYCGTETANETINDAQ